MDTEQANLTNISLKRTKFQLWEQSPSSVCMGKYPPLLPLCSVLQSALRLACLAKLGSLELLFTSDKFDGASSGLFCSTNDQNLDILEQHKEGCSVFWLHTSLPRLALSPGSGSTADVVSGKDCSVLFYLEIIVWRLESLGNLHHHLFCHPCSQIVMLK